MIYEDIWDCDPNSRFDFVIVPNSGIDIVCTDPTANLE